MVPQGVSNPPQNPSISLRTRFASNTTYFQPRFLKPQQHRMGDLKTLAFEAIVSSFDQLSSSELVEEACSTFTSQ